MSTLVTQYDSLVAKIVARRTALATAEDNLTTFLGRPLKGGPDVSQWQGSIDQPAIAAQGYEFILYKASEGLTIKDSMLSSVRVDLTRAAGLTMGFYHFARPQPGRTGRQEAQWFLNCVRSVGGFVPGDLVPVLDIEWSRGLTATQVRDWCSDFCKTMRDELGRGCITYTGHFWNDFVRLPAPEQGGTLWNAHYTDAAEPRPIIGFPRWTFWQFTQTGSIRGIPTECDINRFNGTVEDFLGLLLK